MRTDKDTDLKPGDKIGNYHLMAYLNSGAAGDVFSCTALENKNLVSRGRKYAIKLYKPWILREPHQLLRIKRECKIGSKIIHPNLMRIYDASIDLDKLNGTYLVMEFLEGETLASFIARKHPLALRLTIDILTQICRGVTTLHEHHIIHRDLKPENVMILNGEMVKIMDYGVSKPTKLATITPSDKFVGTIRNSSPELLFGEPYDYKTDIYSIGTILSNMLVGKPIFSEIKRFSNLVLAIKEGFDADYGEIDQLSETSDHHYLKKILRNLCIEMLASEPSLRPTIRTILECVSKGEWSNYWIEKLCIYDRRQYTPLNLGMKWHKPDTCNRSNPNESTRVLIRQYQNQKETTLERKFRILKKIDLIALNSIRWVEAIKLILYLKHTERNKDAQTLLNIFREIHTESISVEQEEIGFRPRAAAKLNKFLDCKGIKERFSDRISVDFVL
jgi:serine/threonine protein kinase